MENLRKMFLNMRNNEITANIFDVTYNRHIFTCILLLNDYGSTLLITMFIGAHNAQTIAVDLDEECNTPISLSYEEYRVLAQFLGFTGTTGNRFIPREFFKQFDQQIDPNLNRTPTLQERIRAIGRAVNIAENRNKVYFCGWRENKNSGTVTNKNYAKTRIMLGEKYAKKLRAANISSRWTANEQDEDLEQINRYLNLLDN